MTTQMLIQTNDYDLSLTGLTIYGPINDRMREMAAGLEYVHYESFAAGFAR